MYPENPEGTQLIVGSMNMGYDIFDPAMNRTHFSFINVVFALFLQTST